MQENQTPSTTPPFRLDVSSHELLMKPQERSVVPLPPGGVAQQLRTPVFPQHKALYDWGTIENRKFEERQLKEMKHRCQKDCFSTLNHILAFCYNDGRVLNWLFEQAKHGFQGVTGNMPSKVQNIRPNPQNPESKVQGVA